MVKDIFNIIKSGTEEIIFENDLFDILLNKDICVKVGFDPTSSNLHLGHLVLLNKLKQFQSFGYKVNIIIGDFTAMIGDPSGRNKSRNQLTKDEILINYSNYENQIFKVLNSDYTKFLFNSNWFNDFSLNKFLEISSMFTLSRVLERNDFKHRYNNNIPIGVNEFLYPFMQAYDSVVIGSNIEIGGVDQKFNLLFARELQKKFFQKPQVLIMLPLLKGIDGVYKMSKTANNCINILDNSYDIFCKIMSIPDILMRDYFIYLGFYSNVDFDNIFIKADNKMELKFDLAIKIVSMLYSSKDAYRSKEKFVSQFCNRDIPNDLGSIDIFVNDNEISVLELLKRSNFVCSISEARRMIKQKSVKLNGEVIENKNLFLKCNDSYILSIGRKKIFKIFLKKI